MGGGMPSREASFGRNQSKVLHAYMRAYTRYSKEMKLSMDEKA